MIRNCSNASTEPMTDKISARAACGLMIGGEVLKNYP